MFIRGGAVLLTTETAESKERGGAPWGEHPGHEEGKADNEDGEGEQDEGDDARPLQVCVGKGRLVGGKLLWEGVLRSSEWEGERGRDSSTGAVSERSRRWEGGWREVGQGGWCWGGGGYWRCCRGLGGWSCWQGTTRRPPWTCQWLLQPHHLPVGLDGGGGLEGDAPQAGEHRPMHLTGTKLDCSLRNLT